MYEYVWDLNITVLQKTQPKFKTTRCGNVLPLFNFNPSGGVGNSNTVFNRCHN